MPAVGYVIEEKKMACMTKSPRLVSARAYLQFRRVLAPTSEKKLAILADDYPPCM